MARTIAQRELRNENAKVIEAGKKLKVVHAVGKHLGYDFGKDRILHVHLGLQGDFTEGSGPLPEVKGALRLRMWNAAAVKRPAVEGVSKRHAWYSEDDGAGHIDADKIAWVELRGPMDCSIYTQKKWDELRERLGPDPLGSDPNWDAPERMVARVAKSRKTIGAGTSTSARRRSLIHSPTAPATDATAGSQPSPQVSVAR